MPIDIGDIATRGRESEREMVGERDRDREVYNLHKHFPIYYIERNEGMAKVTILQYY